MCLCLLSFTRLVLLIQIPKEALLFCAVVVYNLITCDILVIVLVECVHHYVEISSACAVSG